MVQLKAFDLQNASVHYKWSSDKELTYYDSDYPHQKESFEDFLKRMKQVLDHRNTTNELYEIHLSEKDKLIGIVDIHAIDTYNNRCFVNCTIGDRNYMGKGYEEEALEKVLSHCFNEKGMHKVGTSAFDFNTSWIKSVEQLGFHQEAQLRDHVLKNDEYCDKLIFSLLKDNFKTNQADPVLAE